MLDALNRRNFMQFGLAAGAATLAPRWLSAQAAVPKRIADGRKIAETTPIKTTRLADDVFLLQGFGGNMILQTGPEGHILIDSSFSTSVQKVLAAINAVSSGTPHILINTHWHYDHTDGNEGMHAAGFKILAHTKTRERLSTPQVVDFFHITVPPDPAGSWPTITFDDTMQLWHNSDVLELQHFDPAHTDTDIFIHFKNADVLHVGDTWFNGMYPFIDESSAGNIGGMVEANKKALARSGPNTKIIPGHGPLGDKSQLQQFHDMLSTVRDRVATLKAGGASEPEVIAKKPTADLDPIWNKGSFTPDQFVGICYRTV